MPIECLGYMNIFRIFNQGDHSRKKVAFQAFNMQIAQVFRPIIRNLKKNKDIDIYFLVMFHPYSGFKGLKDTKQYARQVLKIESNKIRYIWQAYWTKFDCLICSDVYAKFPIRPTDKIIIPHGPGLLTRWVKANRLRKTVFDFDRYFLCGEFDRIQIKDYIKHRPQLKVVGFPFLDSLAFKEREPQKEESVQRSHRKSVLYAPGWGHGYRYGDMLSINIQQVISCLLDKKINIILKLHADSYVKAQAKGISWKKQLEKYRQYDKIHVVFDLDDRPYFKMADILVTDYSSRSFSFMITGRPVIIYGIPQNFTHTRIEKLRLEKICEAAHVALNVEELSEALDRCLYHPEAMSLERKRVVKEVFANIGSATSEMVKSIEERIGC